MVQACQNVAFLCILEGKIVSLSVVVQAQFWFAWFTMASLKLYWILYWEWWQKRLQLPFLHPLNGGRRWEESATIKGSVIPNFVYITVLKKISLTLQQKRWNRPCREITEIEFQKQCRHGAQLSKYFCIVPHIIFNLTPTLLIANQFGFWAHELENWNCSQCADDGLGVVSSLIWVSLSFNFEAKSKLNAWLGLRFLAGS